MFVSVNCFAFSIFSFFFFFFQIFFIKEGNYRINPRRGFLPCVSYPVMIFIMIRIRELRGQNRNIICSFFHIFTKTSKFLFLASANAETFNKVIITLYLMFISTGFLADPLRATNRILQSRS